jgi:Aspartate/tyrosine/aromatic aminotransferase
MVSEFKRRRDLVVGRLHDMGIKCNLPHGAFYVFPSTDNPEKFMEEALKKDVVLVPGTSFGQYGAGHFRISYAASYQDLEEAMDRLESIGW